MIRKGEVRQKRKEEYVEVQETAHVSLARSTPWFDPRAALPNKDKFSAALDCRKRLYFHP
jgi:hypothetical protein